MMWKRGLDTFYNGYQFRSRLEARWAIFFDTLGIHYEYEPQLFDVDPSYLPDFFLDVKASKWIHLQGKESPNWCDRGMWVEVKPLQPDCEERIKAIRLSRATGYPVVFLVGDPAVSMHRVVFPTIPRPKIDEYAWCMCPACRDVGLVWPWTHSGKEYRQLRCCKRRVLRAHAKENAIKAVETAVAKARSERFEVFAI